MTAAMDEAVLRLASDEAVRAVLRETLELLRAALASVLDDEDEADAYGLDR